MARTFPYPDHTAAVNPPPLHGKRSRSCSSAESDIYQSFFTISQTPDLDKKGGFFKVKLPGDDTKCCEIFIFPIVGNMRQCDRDQNVKVFTAKLNKLDSSGEDDKVEKVLSRIVNKENKDCVWSKSFGRAVKNLPPDSKGRKVELSEKQPGPRLPQLESIFHVHSELDTLKVDRFLNLPDRKARFLRSAAILPLAPEHRVKTFRDKLLGGLNGFVEVKKRSLLKWYRKSKTEVENQSVNGSKKRLEIVWGFIPPALEHWCSFLHSQGQLLSLDRKF